MSIGERIRELRREQRKSLRGLAGEVEISVAYLSNIEKGESSPTVEVLQKLADALKVEVRELTEAVEERPAFELPDSLRDFIDAYASKFEELKDADWQRALSGVRFRGRYPKDAEDWLPIFASMRTALSRDE
jgi:transcriptional regulator with XRE-family HTH domain